MSVTAHLIDGTAYRLTGIKTLAELWERLNDAPFEHKAVFLEASIRYDHDWVGRSDARTHAKTVFVALDHVVRFAEYR